MGIHGEGQVVGVGDSGLYAGQSGQQGSCFFTDPSNPLTADTNMADGFSINQAHRKVVSYFAFADATAGASTRDHGTHVCGSVAGKSAGTVGGGGLPPRMLNTRGVSSFNDLKNRNNTRILVVKFVFYCILFTEPPYLAT